MLFVRYDSSRENVTGVASRLRTVLPRFFPMLPSSVMEIQGESPRPTSGEPYKELIIVGHSLGGLIVRRALVDAAQEWRDERRLDPGAPMPTMLQARTRLFSPASAGFQPAGLLGMARASPSWTFLNILLRGSSAYSDLQPGSTLLTETRRRTEMYAELGGEEAEALRASLVFANPDNVVITERYDSDYVERAVDGTTHLGVCKPGEAFAAPRRFVETGSPDP